MYMYTYLLAAPGVFPGQTVGDCVVCASHRGLVQVVVGAGWVANRGRRHSG